MHLLFNLLDVRNVLKMKEYLRNKLLELKKHHNAENFLNNYCTKELKRQWERDRK